MNELNNMLCVGLTGNIASGKSTALAYFVEQGVSVFSADKIAHELTQKDTPLFNKIINHFGKSILTEEGLLNRKALRHIIFSDKKQKTWLENLLHPAIRSELSYQISKAQGPYTVIEIPLLYDRTKYPYINRILLITSSTPIQIQRIMIRDQCDEEAAKILLANQLSDSIRKKIADDIIENNGDRAALIQKLQELNVRYMNNRFIF